MPEYYFAVRRSDQEHMDEHATALNDNAAALDYACHMVRELRADFVAESVLEGRVGRRGDILGRAEVTVLRQPDAGRAL